MALAEGGAGRRWRWPKVALTRGGVVACVKLRLSYVQRCDEGPGTLECGWTCVHVCRACARVFGRACAGWLMHGLARVGLCRSSPWCALLWAPWRGAELTLVCSAVGAVARCRSGCVFVPVPSSRSYVGVRRSRAVRWLFNRVVRRWGVLYHSAVRRWECPVLSHRAQCAGWIRRCGFPSRCARMGCWSVFALHRAVRRWAQVGVSVLSHRCVVRRVDQVRLPRAVRRGCLQEQKSPFACAGPTRWAGHPWRDGGGGGGVPVPAGWDHVEVPPQRKPKGQLKNVKTAHLLWHCMPGDGPP